METLQAKLVRKRRRPPKSCEQCRKRKVKCDQNLPCNQCIRMKVDDCTYSQEFKTNPTLSRQANSGVDSSSAINFPPTPVSTIDPERQSKQNHQDDATVAVFGDPFTKGVCNFNRTDDPFEGPDERRPCEGFLGGDREPVAFLKHQSTKPTCRLNGMLTKTRLLGKSHWMNIVYQIRFLPDLKATLETGQNGNITALLEECKAVGRSIKSQDLSEVNASANIRDLVPPKELADRLFNNYFRAFESFYRILHVPSFQREYEKYWEAPKAASESSLLKLLLVFAVGVSVDKDLQSRRSLRISAMQWINAAQNWLSSPFTEKTKINISGVQVHCLLLLAREANAFGPDSIWISAGSLYRTAMLTGLHREPTRLARLSPFISEIRRRLWATVTELCLQASMNAGGLPMVSAELYDCQPPSNLDDEDLDAEGGTVQPPKPEGVFTRSSIQSALLQTLPVRSRIAQLLNDFQANPSFRETLQLGNSLSESLYRISTHLKKSRVGLQHPEDDTDLKVYEVMTYRFLISLHQDFAVKAVRDPAFYFSRKVCMDTALQLAILAIPASRADYDLYTADFSDFERLLRTGSGTYKNVLLISFVVICLEIVCQLKDVDSAPLSPSDAILREECFRMLDRYVNYAHDRVRVGETNVKGYVFAHAMLAHHKACAAGKQGEGAAFVAAEEAMHLALKALRSNLLAVTHSQTATPFMDQSIGDFDMPFGSSLDLEGWEQDYNPYFGFLNFIYSIDET